MRRAEQLGFFSPLPNHMISENKISRDQNRRSIAAVLLFWGISDYFDAEDASAE